MKANYVGLLLGLALSMISLLSAAQGGQKWSLGGNSAGNGDFLGTTNQSPLMIKTNDEKRIKIGSNGNIKFFDFGFGANGFLSTDSSGLLNKTLFNGNQNYVLTGDGSFQLAQALIPGWKVEISNKIYSTPDYKIGIGTENPDAILDVNGDAIVRGTLHVYDGIIIGKTYTGEKATLDTVEATKMQADEMKATSYKTNTISIDGNNSSITSATGQISFGNNSISAGTITTGNMNVQGNTSFTNLTVTQVLRIGVGTLYLTGINTPTGPMNSIFTSNGDLKIQCDAANNYNTIINANNTGYVGIGTEAPQQNLHIKGKTNLSGVNIDDHTTQLSAIIRLEDEAYGASNMALNRTSHWDIAASASRQGLYFRTDQGSGGSSLLEVMRLNENGQIVMGPTQNCSYPGNIKLIVDGHLLLTDGPNEEPRTIYWGYHCQPEWGLEYNSSDGGLNFWNPATSSSGLVNYRLFLQNGTGNIGIGTNTPEHKLDVCGTIRGKEVIVSTDWCDYKFAPEYEVMTWQEKKQFIENNRHLPEIDPASVIETDGLAVARNMRGMVSNIEDNTLDIIRLSEQNAELIKYIQNLETQLKELEEIIIKSANQ